MKKTIKREVIALKTLKIVFTILSAICVAAVIPVSFFNAVACAWCVAAALVFAGAMLLVKRLEEKQSTKNAPKEPDFLNSDEKN